MVRNSCLLDTNRCHLGLCNTLVTINENKNSSLIYLLYPEHVILYENITEMCLMIEENSVLTFSYEPSVHVLKQILCIRDEVYCQFYRCHFRLV